MCQSRPLRYVGVNSPGLLQCAQAFEIGGTTVKEFEPTLRKPQVGIFEQQTPTLSVGVNSPGLLQCAQAFEIGGSLKKGMLLTTSLSTKLTNYK